MSKYLLSRQLQAPGGNSSDIFNTKSGSNSAESSVNGTNGTNTPTPSTPTFSENGTNPLNGTNVINGTIINNVTAVDAGKSTATMPVINGINGHKEANGTYGHNAANGNGYNSPSPTPSTPTSSASSSRRGSKCEVDTKNRLFGPEPASPSRRIIDRQKSNIFNETPSPTRHVSPKKLISRNPITGEIYNLADQLDGKLNGLHISNGTNGVNGNGHTGTNGSGSLPTTPVRVRQPPGGKSSGIF